jgi:hypothetical protein
VYEGPPECDVDGSAEMSWFDGSEGPDLISADDSLRLGLFEPLKSE